MELTARNRCLLIGAAIVGGALLIVVLVFATADRTSESADDHDTATGDDGTGGPDGGTATEEPVSASVADSFGRPNADELGATDTGQPWSVVSGEWGIREGQVVVLGPEDPTPKLAVVNTKSAEGTVEVTLSQVVAGAGLVFRYKGPRNFWSLTAAPGSATWQVRQVVDGEPVLAESVGLASVDNGTRAGVLLDGDTATVYINGTAVAELVGIASDATQAGLIASGVEAPAARWDNFQVSE